MKKLLALVLALVMTMSLVTISNAAFSDADKIDHSEAVEVLNTLGVINGMPDGSFAPAGNVTRAEMAKMISIIMLGNVDADAFKGTITDLTDINGHWGEGFIKYCYSQGIIAGRGDGTFAPNANVTAVEAAKMLLGAIGYNSDVQGYVGSDWAINVTRDAQLSGFYADLKGLTANKTLTRDEAAQMIYNAVDTGIVKKTPNWNSSTGVVTYSYNKQPDTDDLLKNTFDVTTTETKLNKTEYSSEKKEYTYTLADAVNGSATVKSTSDFSGLFGMKVKVMWTTNKSNDTVVYGIYATKSVVLAETVIGSIDFAKIADKEIKIGDTTYKTEDNSATMFVKDNTTADLTTKVAAGAGYCSAKLVDLDGNGKVDFIVYTPAVVGKVSYVGKSTISVKTEYGAAASYSVKDDTIYTGIAKDDYIVVTDGLDGHKVVTKLDSKFTAKVNKISSYAAAPNATKATKLVIGGNTYKVADISKDEITSSAIGKDLTAVSYNGYLFYVDSSSTIGVDKFAMVTAAEANVTGLNKNRQAILLFTDGSKKTVDVANDYTSLKNKMVTFSITDDVYTLTVPTDASGTDFATDGGYAASEAYTKSTGKTASGYTVSDNAIIFSKDSKGNWIVSTGADVKKGDNTITQAFYKTTKSTGYSAIELGVVGGTISVTNSNYAVVLSGIATVADKDDNKVAEFDIWTVDGKKTVTTTNLYNASVITGLAKGDVITFTDKGDGVITVDAEETLTESAVVAYNPVANKDGENDISFAGGSASSGTIAKSTPVAAITDKDTVVLYIDKDGSTYTGIEGGEIRLATETNTTGTYYTNVAYSVVSGTVKVLVVEVDNNFSDVTM